VRHTWTVIIDNDRDERGGPFTAYVEKDWGDPRDTPFKATGDTPVLAVAALLDVLRDWAAGGSDRWLDKPQGQQLVDHFTMGERLPSPPEKARA